MNTTAIDNRHHVTCSCCGLVSSSRGRGEAKADMVRHLERHEVTETIVTAVYDTMAKGGGHDGLKV